MSSWIKLEKSTPMKPEILEMAEILGINRADVLLTCLQFWFWCDDNQKSGSTKLKDTAMVDEIVGREGFGLALKKVGWLTVSGGYLKIGYCPSFVLVETITKIKGLKISP